MNVQTQSSSKRKTGEKFREGAVGEDVVSGATLSVLEMEEGRPHAKERGRALDARKGQEMETLEGNSPADSLASAQGPTVGSRPADQRGKCVVF